MLGTDTDAAVARKLGRTWGAVVSRRFLFGIPRFRERQAPSEVDADRIKKRRIQMKLTQEQAARRTRELGRQRWNDIERGREVNLPMRVLEAISVALGVKAKDLLK